MASWLAALRPPAPPQTAFDRAVAALETGRPDAALVELERAFEEAADAPACARVLNKRGVALVALDRRDDARAAFEAALELDPRSAAAIVNLGNLLLEAGDVEQAVERYRTALRVDEQYAPAHRNLGIACKRAGKRSEAVGHFRTATRLELRWKKRR
jgi:tetratricopeptide (TPR) repeat protein